MSLIAMKLKTLSLRFQEAERGTECRKRKPACCCNRECLLQDKALRKAPGEQLRIMCCWTSGVSKGGDAEAANIISLLLGEDTEDKKLCPVCSIFLKINVYFLCLFYSSVWFHFSWIGTSKV